MLGLKELSKEIKKYLNKKNKLDIKNKDKEKIGKFAQELIKHKKCLIDFRIRTEGEFLANKWKNIKDKYDSG